MNLVYMCGAALFNFEVAEVLRSITQILMLVISVCLIVAVLLQKPVSNNIGTIAGEETQTYAGRNKSKSWDKILRKVTIGLGVALAVLAVFYYVTRLSF